MVILLTIFAYFLIIFFLGKVSSKDSSNQAFFFASRKSKWWVVSFGMIGASISGVTFVSVPGMVIKYNMTYIETCLGFIIGYFIVAFFLLPIYYRLNLNTIYTFLHHRLGKKSYKTGAMFFILSDLIGSAVKFYVVCMLMDNYFCKEYGIPFYVTVLVLIFMVWLYTRKGGVKTLVWTDFFQTLCMLIALTLIIINVMGELDVDIFKATKMITASSHSQIFDFSCFKSSQNFFKQFFSGIFIVIVMTGLNQNMMQKNLTCKTLKDAKKDMCSYAFAFVPVNLLMLSLGVLLLILAQNKGIAIGNNPDELLAIFACTNRLGSLTLVLFVIAVTAASFSSIDSSLTALTTTFCLDIKEQPKDESLRKKVHLSLAIVFAIFIILFRYINSTSMIDAIYILCSYTYGPLLGLFSFGLLTKREVKDKLIPYIAISSPLICLALDFILSRFYGYKFSYEMLLLNGLITFLGISIASKKNKRALSN